MTIIAYTGHPGGAAEALAIQQFLRRLPTVDFKVHEPFPVPERIAATRLFVVHARLTKELGDETNCLSEGRSNEITN